jgi:RecA/RadA recombinase
MNLMFETAFTMAQHRGTRCPTGIPLLDELLGGGFESGLSYLLYGSSDCTKMLQQTIATALLHYGPQSGIVVIDANNGIRPDIILSHLRAASGSMPPDSHLQRLNVARAFTTDQLLSLLSEAPDTIHELHAPILFVNGLTHLLQEEEESTPQVTTAGAPLDLRVFRRGQLASHLKQLAFIQQIAVIVSADAPKRSRKPPLRIGQAARHRFHVLIQHTGQDLVETFTLEKHPSRPWMQRSTVKSQPRRRPSSYQTTLFAE